MPTQSTNFGLFLPLVNNPTDQDLWGGYLNTDISNLDSLLLSALNFTTSAQTSSFSVTGMTAGSPAVGNNKTLFACTATSGAIIATLPAASASAGLHIAFKKMDTSANAVTVTAAGSDLIDGQPTFPIATQYGYVMLVCDGTQWNIVASSTMTTAPGRIVMQALSTVPTGYLECDGSAISRTTYSGLFTAIGTTYGVGDGSTTFNVPDFRGYFPRGWAHAGSVDSGRAIGSTQTDAFQGHNMQTTLSVCTSDGGGSISIGSGRALEQVTSTPISDGTNGTPRTATETRPVNVAVMFCIKT